jgi:hypothetical protein
MAKRRGEGRQGGEKGEEKEFIRRKGRGTE